MNARIVRKKLEAMMGIPTGAAQRKVSSTVVAGASGPKKSQLQNN